MEFNDQLENNIQSFGLNSQRSREFITREFVKMNACLRVRWFEAKNTLVCCLSVAVVSLFLSRADSTCSFP